MLEGLGELPWRKQQYADPSLPPFKRPPWALETASSKARSRRRTFSASSTWPIATHCSVTSLLGSIVDAPE